MTVAKPPVRPAVVTVTEAAELADVARSTINRKIKAGGLSREPGGGIQVAELERVFGTLGLPGESLGAADAMAHAPEHDGALLHAAPAHVEHGIPSWLLEQLSRLQGQNEMLLAQLAQKDTALQSAAEAHREELTRMLGRLDRLLPAPADAGEPVAATPPDAGFWRRLFG